MPSDSARGAAQLLVLIEVEADARVSRIELERGQPERREVLARRPRPIPVGSCTRSTGSSRFSREACRTETSPPSRARSRRVSSAAITGPTIAGSRRAFATRSSPTCPCSHSQSNDCAPSTMPSAAASLRERRVERRRRATRCRSCGSGDRRGVARLRIRGERRCSRSKRGKERFHDRLSDDRSTRPDASLVAPWRDRSVVVVALALASPGALRVERRELRRLRARAARCRTRQWDVADHGAERRRGWPQVHSAPATGLPPGTARSKNDCLGARFDGSEDEALHTRGSWR